MVEGQLSNILDNINELPRITTSTPLNAEIARYANLSFQDHEITGLNEMDSFGKINDANLKKATEEILEQRCSDYLNKEGPLNEDTSELNNKLVEYVIQNTIRLEDGRLQMPLMWNGEVEHLLGKNYDLSLQILKSNFKKLSKNPEHLKMTDDVFKEQEQEGIIEKIPNLEQFMNENPQCSFLPHMSVFRPHKETTKCRVVYLSNLCGKDPSKPLTVCHNQAIHSGPNLNHKLTTSVLLLRFDPYLLIFDIKRAFLNIALTESDQARLLTLWYRNVAKQDFSIVAYKQKTVLFGVSCSPCLLMLALYKILILDNKDGEKVTRLKELVYSLTYMDNGAFSSSKRTDLAWAWQELIRIFKLYQFNLQQFATNDETVQTQLDETAEEPTTETINLLGLQWDRRRDQLSVKPLRLDQTASTKRAVLRSLAQNFDPFNYNGPLLNRARIFMHTLQCDKTIKWDSKLMPAYLKEWKKICTQLNAAPEIKLPRCVGKRDSRYKLIGFTDASKLMYGTVVYLQDQETMETSFLLAKNRLVTKQLETKGIPSLEFQAAVLGVETLHDIHKDLTSTEINHPIHIEGVICYSDSMVVLNWINSYTHKYDKLQAKRGVFLMNRLHKIATLCADCPMRFSFVAGTENPADYISRPVSYKQLMQSNYHSGPEFLKKLRDPSAGSALDVIVPNPLCVTAVAACKLDQTTAAVAVAGGGSVEHLVPVNKYSSLSRLVAVHGRVLMFVDKLKQRLKDSAPQKYAHLQCNINSNFQKKAWLQIVQRDQEIHFGDCIDYFNTNPRARRDLPNIIGQLNIVRDENRLLRVHSKFDRARFKNWPVFPVLLARTSALTKLLIQNLHSDYSHAGPYTLLAELRKLYYIPKFFSTVKGVIRDCVTCKRFNSKPVQLNQSAYREFRADPPKIPFKSVFVDYFGPYEIKLEGRKCKVWVLCITCLWSRAINLKICLDQTATQFLKSFQYHVYEYGVPETVYSDLGTNLVAAGNLLRDFLRDPDTILYLQQYNLNPIKFQQYFKGNSELGSLVESAVKLVKRLMFGSLGNRIIDYFEFEFLVRKVVHLVNKRPVAFRECLRSTEILSAPEPITPKMLIHGRELPSVNCIPNLQPDPEPEEWNVNPTQLIRDSYAKMRKILESMTDVYHDEFLSTLIKQATDKKDRYTPVQHRGLRVGDIVLIKEKYVKPNNFPLAIVIELQVNEFNEVTGAKVRKGSTNEIVKRHSSSLIPILCCEPTPNCTGVDQIKEPVVEIRRSKRLAARMS